MEALSRFAAELGREDDRELWTRRAKELAGCIRQTLWRPESELFFDAVFDSHEPVRIVTPACFLPVWAGVMPDEARLARMIDNVLLAPDHLGGDVPFPVVGRSEERYDNDGWWRGPVWMNIAHLMLETLRRTGRLQERRDAMRRLLAVVERNVDPRELYDSRSGNGLGAHELGWTASVAMVWIDELAKAASAP
jgi:putative isomerase